MKIGFRFHGPNPPNARSMKNLNRRSKLSLCLVATILAALLSVPSLSAQTVWTDGTGDWFSARNWSAGVPSSSVSAQINNGGTAQITAGGAAVGSITLGLALSDSGTLSTSGSGNLDATSGIFFIGESGTGVVNITAGGVVSGDRFIMGDNAGSTGTATVSGSGSMWTNNATCDVGFSGNATLSITDGGSVSAPAGTVAENPTSTSTATVDGTGSAWTLISTLTVGGNGTATLNIKNGGTVLGTGPTFGGGVIGNNPGAQGTANLDGVGSNWTMSGPLAIGGNGGAGTLHITNGAAVSSSYGILADANGATGTVTVDGAGSTWTNSGALYVGNRGSSAMLSITNGGKVSNSDGFIGFGTASGTVTVDGVGSTWTNSGNLYVGGSNTGLAGNGTLRIQNSGTVQATETTIWSTGALEIGLTPNLSGTLTFNGGTLRTVANTAFANNASLGAGGVKVDSNGFNSTLSGSYTGAGSFTKTNTGSITLSGASTYTGGTTVSGGTLLVSNTSGSGTGTGAVQVNAGTLGGTGTIAGAVTVGTGTGAGASISPGSSVGTLTIQSALTLNSDATYKFELNSSTVLADKIVANGVTINGASLSFTDLDTAHLDPGTAFVVINNMSASAISGFFSNLADNSTFASNGNTFVASYEGGTGNDLTITVVPEPAIWQLLCSATVIAFVGRKIFLTRQAVGK
jgi:T5SS/PEP-CTERM-associated repeat protein/autotransporter-associated beta strand protein